MNLFGRDSDEKRRKQEYEDAADEARKSAEILSQTIDDARRHKEIQQHIRELNKAATA